ncbi:uncharacterized protein FPRO_10327 [Fusarium proliferatum ET1]|uniref:Uncharacterized protein n=1 Tax=Fusarium proliferatum (strain ET1) TaxID=1227346 RepID=A0A1L7VJL2_FUSPR|nr:uncharacterized protein FPRO_10327 [Fusarium proliferatum ET1]CZR40739.1 uncharacterized protein FPRO_10327 [Fusarium proliferatum ET1]
MDQARQLSTKATRSKLTTNEEVINRSEEQRLVLTHSRHQASSRDESQGTWAHFARRFTTNKPRLIPRASDECFPSRTSTKVFCCIDQGPPKMHSYSLASIHHGEVDSLEDPSSSDGAVDVDSSHHLEAALHEVMEKEKVYRHDQRSSRPRVALNATGALQCLQVHARREPCQLNVSHVPADQRDKPAAQTSSNGVIHRASTSDTRH